MKRLPILLAIWSVASTAGASGFSTARFGGEHGHPTTDNPTALYFNPAGLALGHGTRVYLDVALALRNATYERPRAAISNPGDGTPDDALDANAGTAKLDNVAFIPFGAIVSDFGIENFGAGVGVYVPLGGSASWDRNTGFEGARGEAYPGAVDGVQRWFTIEGTIRSLYLTAAAAYRIPSLRLSFGAGLNVIQSQVHTVRARNADGTDDLVQGGFPKEGRSLIDVESWDLGFSVGAIWEPAERFWVGASYQSQPGFGQIALKGKLEIQLPVAEGTTQDVVLTQSLPDIWRLGLRWQPRERWELRLFGEYARWSVLQDQCVFREGGSCEIGEDGAETGDSSGVVQNIPRRWRDGFGVRAGVSHWVVPSVEAYVGLGYDSDAIPDRTLDPSLYDMNKISASVGARVELTDWWSVAATLTPVFYFTREIEVADSQGFDPPSAQPNAAGTYSQFIGVLDVNTEFRF